MITKNNINNAINEGIKLREENLKKKELNKIQKEVEINAKEIVFKNITNVYLSFDIPKSV